MGPNTRRWRKPPLETIAAVTGLSQSYAGKVWRRAGGALLLEPVISCRVTLPEGTDPPYRTSGNSCASWRGRTRSSTWSGRSRSGDPGAADGRIQREILQSVAMERFGLAIGFEAGSILLWVRPSPPGGRALATGAAAPLCRGALLMEPLPRGSGAVTKATAPTDKRI